MKKNLLLFLLLIITTSCNTEYYSKMKHFMGETISAQELKTAIDDDLGYIIIDIRPSHKYQGGHIPTAINIPAHELHTLIDTSYHLFPIVIYGQEIAKQKSAYKEIINMGYTDVRHLYGGYSSWNDETETGND